MDTDNVHLFILLLAFTCIQLIDPSICSGAPTLGCIPAERSALLDFKHGLKDPTNRLSSWVGEGCCKWEGVTCSSHSGHVVKLDLSNPHPLPDTDDQPRNKWSLEGELRPSLLGLKQLRYLDLSMNNFGGSTIPEFLGSFHELQHLNLSRAGLGGALPYQLGLLASLQQLSLSYNQLEGTVPESVGWLPELVHLDLRSNSLEGVISEAHLGSLRKLKYLGLSSNSLVLKVKSNWIPPFQIEFLGMGSCKLGPQFPAWLRTQENILLIDLSNAGISDTMPNWFWSFISPTSYVDLSRNQISGQLPNLMHLNSLKILDLNSNFIYGPLPYFPHGLEFLDLSNNSLSGPIPPFIIMSMPDLNYLSLLKNFFSGEIPSSVCQLLFLIGLDLSKNLLSGELPNCWNHSSSKIIVLDFSSNNISGGIPESVCSISSLQSLLLSNNRLSGELPLSLKDCGGLLILDAGDNELKGQIPTWVGESLISLNILKLRSNKLDGDIPPNLARLSSLQILDLASNKLSGTIPWTFGNFTAMKFTRKLTDAFGHCVEMPVIIKGRILQYDKLLPLLNILDLSDNNLIGVIPEELMSLSGLFSLNLSGNHLTGEISEKIGALRQLESLDLSRNNLSNVIPSSIIALTSLSYLNLSYNNLSGKIPSGKQLLTFNDPSTYTGNPSLCGFPLNQSCKDSETAQDQNVLDVRDENEKMWFYMSIAPGFVAGLLIWGTLLLNNTWNHYYFRFIVSMFDKVHAITRSEPV